MSERMKRKTVLITGAGGGIGLATARSLVREGAAVAIVDLDAGRAEQAASDFRAQGAKAYAVAADVTDWAAVSTAVRKTEAMLGCIDGLVNNAGVADLGSVHETDERQWNRIMAVNVTGAFLVSKAVLPGMIERQRGAIVNIGSVAGMVGIPNMAAYCASKGAVINLTRQMAIDRQMGHPGQRRRGRNGRLHRDGGHAVEERCHSRDAGPSASQISVGPLRRATRHCGGGALSAERRSLIRYRRRYDGRRWDDCALTIMPESAEFKLQ
jgi:NADP-dependent 3-hydroxy acid dehydrogenase YdfG